MPEEPRYKLRWVLTLPRINPLIARDRHHRAKQARGWQLTQPEPGTMVWITPSGRSYATGPAAYPG